MTKWPRRFCCQHASVFSAAERRFLALADDRDPIGGDAEADQVVTDRVAAAVAEGEVVFAGASLVAVPFNADLGRRPPLHPLRVLLEQGAGIVADRRLVEIEEDVAQRPLGVQLLERLRLKISSSVSAAGAGGAGGGAGGGGAGGGVAGAVGGGGGAGAGSAGFLPQAAAPTLMTIAIVKRPAIRRNTVILILHSGRLR